MELKASHQSHHAHVRHSHRHGPSLSSHSHAHGHGHGHHGPASLSSRSHAHFGHGHRHGRSHSHHGHGHGHSHKSLANASSISVFSSHSSNKASVYHRGLPSQFGNHRGLPSQFGRQPPLEKVFFLVPKDVLITYGPYFNLGVLDYRCERLRGLTRTLKKCGANITLKPNFFLNEIRVWHLEQEIFACRLNELQHGGDGDLDYLCMDAGRAFERSVRNAYTHLTDRYRYETSSLKTGCPCPTVGIEGITEDPAFSYYEVIPPPQPPTSQIRQSIAFGGGRASVMNKTQSVRGIGSARHKSLVGKQHTSGKSRRKSQNQKQNRQKSISQNSNQNIINTSNASIQQHEQQDDGNEQDKEQTANSVSIKEDEETIPIPFTQTEPIEVNPDAEAEPITEEVIPDTEAGPIEEVFPDTEAGPIEEVFPDTEADPFEDVIPDNEPEPIEEVIQSTEPEPIEDDFGNLL